MAETETHKVKFYNVNDGLTGRDGGPYMDQVDAEQAEIVRAKIEGRSPNLKNPPAIAGQVLVTEAQLLASGGNIPASKQNGFVVEQDGIKAKPVRTIDVPNAAPAEVTPVTSSVKDDSKDGKDSGLGDPPPDTSKADNKEADDKK